MPTVKPRIPIQVRHVLYNMRGGFLLRPLIIAIVLGLFGATLSHLELMFPRISDWVPLGVIPSRMDPQGAQVILGTIAGSVMTVVSIVFAILLMTLTLTSMQFSPRILVTFAKDHATQWTLGIFLGTFSFCIAVLPAAHNKPTPSEPVLSVLFAMILALACVAWLLFFIHHISQAISVNNLIDRIAGDTEKAIDEIMPNHWRHRPPPEPLPIGVLEGERPQYSDRSGYVRYIDTSLLRNIAIASRMQIRVLRRAGHFVPEGGVLLGTTKPVEDEARGRLLSAFDVGPTRTLQQDVEFGVLQIVDIALRAISPAVNDPSTAIGCLDHLSRILIRFASRELPESVLYDLAGRERVFIPWLGFERMVESAFEQIRHYSCSDRAVSLRLLRALGDIAETFPDEVGRQPLVDMARRTVECCERKLEEAELQKLRVRLKAIEEDGS